MLVRKIPETTGKRPRLIHLLATARAVASFCRRDPARGTGEGVWAADVPPRTPPISCARRCRTGTEAFPGRCARPRATARRGDSASRRQICDGRRRKQEKARRRSERGGWTIARRWDRWRERERAEPRARRRSRRVHLEPRDAARVSRWRVRRARASRRVAMAVRLSSALVASGVRCRRLRVARDAPGRENHPEQRVVVVHARGHRRSASRAPFDGVEELDGLRACRHPERSVASRSHTADRRNFLSGPPENSHTSALLSSRETRREPIWSTSQVGLDDAACAVVRLSQVRWRTRTFEALAT